MPAEKREKTRIQKVPKLETLYCYISGCCNLSCKHCWISPGSMEKTSFIPLHDLKKAVQQSKALGAGSIKLTGGEPLLHPEIKHIIQMINQEEIFISLETNGTLVDQKMALFLASVNKLAHISVSLDGSNADIHDYLRGKKGSYQQAVNGISHLHSAGFPLQVICTLHRKNMDDVENMVRLAEHMGCGSIKFNHVQKIGRGEAFADQFGLSVPEVLMIYREVEKSLAPTCRIPIYFDIPMAFHSIKKLLRDSQKRCGILNILGVLSNSTYSLCGIGETIPYLTFGNINQHNLQHIWHHSPRLKQIRDLIPHQLEGICSRCIHRDICMGTCVANNYYRTRKISSAYYFCEEAFNLGLFPKSRLLEKFLDF